MKVERSYPQMTPMFTDEKQEGIKPRAPLQT
jgi:hypothetical protein